MKAVIQLTKENHELGFGYIVIRTIFGDIRVPNSKVEVKTKRIIKIPDKVFHAAGFNPCQIVNGYLGSVNK